MNILWMCHFCVKGLEAEQSEQLKIRKFGKLRNHFNFLQKNHILLFSTNLIR